MLLMFLILLERFVRNGGGLLSFKRDISTQVRLWIDGVWVPSGSATEVWSALGGYPMMIDLPAKGLHSRRVVATLGLSLVLSLPVFTHSR